ncbi:Uncharacterized protein FWK35_00006392 [Aphis craccivora]|uniref:Uncharacterized protein n=1 Tax=Aphis craccivora TaxID=307492 RepID=A0A6G0ZNQ6_APHCR|nr:Uncharacterized protein FWK35_00006392 [Aphis craccivora]
MPRTYTVPINRWIGADDIFVLSHITIQSVKRDTATTTTLRPVTPPCFECTTQTAEHPANLCGDYVVTFKYACTDDPCHTTNPCCTHKFGYKKTK